MAVGFAVATMRALDRRLDQAGIADVDEREVLGVTGMTRRGEGPGFDETLAVLAATPGKRFAAAWPMSRDRVPNQRAKFLLSHCPVVRCQLFVVSSS